MRRDMRLVRMILKTVEKADGPVEIEAFLSDMTPSIEAVEYHIGLMEHHGLIDVEHGASYYSGNRPERVLGLTWDGCDYLDAIRDDRVWRKTTEGVKSYAGSVTLDTFKTIASAVAVKMISSGMGLS